MKSILKLSIPLLVILLISNSAFPFTAGIILPKTFAVNIKTAFPDPSPFANMSVKEFLALTPAKYKELTGKKLTLTQKFSLKIAQYKVKRLIKRNKQPDLMLIANDIDTNNFDILGFILGIALGPLGILIAYLIEGKSSSTFRWALYGSLIWLTIFLLVILVL